MDKYIIYSKRFILINISSYPKRIIKYKISYSKNDSKRLNILNRLKESYKQKYY